MLLTAIYPDKAGINVVKLIHNNLVIHSVFDIKPEPNCDIWICS